MKLKSSSLIWAMKHVAKESDTDLFPRPFEFKLMKKKSADVIRELAGIEINQYSWKGPRRLMVPKSEYAFRSACQLDPMDSILFAALAKEIGSKIEKSRSPVSCNKVFSYRFDPDRTGRLYTTTSGWENFWKTSLDHCESNKFVLTTDLSDFYNQIYHHTIENQIDQCGIKVDYWYALKNLLANTTEGVSRGIPIGPHPAHLIAEMSMIPVDQFLDSLGYVWCRYVDDIHIFCNSRDDGHAILYKFVDYLDRTQKIQINKQKTRIMSSGEFDIICEKNKMDHPISPLELEMLNTVKSYTSSPYEKVRMVRLSSTDIAKLSQENIETVLTEYTSAADIDYTRLRWFIRRLTQIGVPGGIYFIVRNFEKFLPAVAEVGNYFESSAPNFHGKWADIGDDLIKIYETGIVQASEYLQVVILSLFARIKNLNHINRLTKVYSTSTSMCQRKIMLAAAEANSKAWLSTLKGQYKNSDPWKRRSVIYSLRVLPDDEKKFWLKTVKKQVEGLDKIVADII